MPCNDGRAKDWDATAGSTFVQAMHGPPGGGFSAEVHIFEGEKPPAVVLLLPDEPLRVHLEADTDYMIITHALVVSAAEIDVQIRSNIGAETHCTTITGKATTNEDVPHSILVS